MHVIRGWKFWITISNLLFLQASNELFQKQFRPRTITRGTARNTTWHYQDYIKEHANCTSVFQNITAMYRSCSSVLSAFVSSAAGHLISVIVVCTLCDWCGSNEMLVAFVPSQRWPLNSSLLRPRFLKDVDSPWTKIFMGYIVYNTVFENF